MDSSTSKRYDKVGNRRHRSPSSESDEERRRHSHRRKGEREREHEREAENVGSSRAGRDDAPRERERRSADMRDEHDDRESKRRRKRSPEGEYRSSHGRSRQHYGRRSRSPPARYTESKHRSKHDHSSDLASLPRSAREDSATQVSRKSKGPLPSQAAAFGHGDSTALVVAEEPLEKEKPNFTATGLLAAASNSVAAADGTSIVLKYHEPPEARKPSAKDIWKLFVFKGEDIIETIELGLRSCWLVGRELAVVDMPAEHPSISKQHAVLQFRYVEKRNEYGDKVGKVKPYLIDLESANGTSLNKDPVPASRYLELRDKDMIQFGHST